MSKSREHDACKKEASKILREMEINMLAERKPDQKVYERFKRKPYEVGGGTIGQKRPDRICGYERGNQGFKEKD